MPGGLGKIMSLVGLVFLGLGVAFVLLGKMPGDIHIERKNFSLYFPLGGNILFSIILSLPFSTTLLIYNLLNR